jgi:hypothetical protein
VERTQASFAEAVGPMRYRPLIPLDQPPPTRLNAEIMDRYRTQMERFYRDASPVFTG